MLRALRGVLDVLDDAVGMFAVICNLLMAGGDADDLGDKDGRIEGPAADILGAGGATSA